MPDNYSGQDLQGRSFAFHDLTGADFSGADLQGATFWQANLSDADLSGAYLFGADLTYATLFLAKLTDAFRRPGIIRADLDGAKGLDTVTGLIDWGHHGSLGVGDRPDPDDRHARVAWLSRFTRSPESLATGCTAPLCRYEPVTHFLGKLIC